MYTAGAEKSKFDVNLPQLGSSRRSSSRHGRSPYGIRPTAPIPAGDVHHTGCSQDHDSWLSPTVPRLHASRRPQLRPQGSTPARSRTNEMGTSARQFIVRPPPPDNSINPFGPGSRPRSSMLCASDAPSPPPRLENNHNVRCSGGDTTSPLLDLCIDLT
ncbi:hypothetical protein PGT21_026096 [Puccinia graminis f. sp. tritici]|uniref:Uncharacterized protein n=1 Tax=Puccinia graminis f. sp. tritici TaxID=56615 RepID=A0A5B0ND33_PUCGR|nr:hypothetical protein PGT21_026096 [Puccinia graminis f. sp. tritici]